MIRSLDILLGAFVAFMAVLEVYRAYQNHRARKSAWKIARPCGYAALFALLAASQFWAEEPVIQLVASHF
jgi:hypothetical protein